IFYVQNRMGKNCTMFRAIKFRSMSVARTIERKFDDPVEDNRITPLGRVLRNSRLDEIPQIINVLKGEMSLIGPRPDYYEHAVIFLKDVKGYELRHIIRPGISGLSQIRLGYAVGIKATKSKVIVDLFYIRNAGFILDAKIIFGTFLTILNRTGN
ncbi:sugar transferase, partial [Amylibacter sp.]|nr:sugar transferase [Amylibacter sp.]